MQQRLLAENPRQQPGSNGLRLQNGSGSLLTAFFAQAVDLKGVARRQVVVLAPDFLLQFADLGREEFDRATALGADHVMVIAAVVLVLIPRHTVMKCDLTGQTALGQQLQGPIHGGEADPGVFLFHEAMELVRGEVISRLEEGAENRVALLSMLQTYTAEVLVEDVLGLAHILARN